ncbi:hypothetical protein FOA52_005009 [Chlamydomonas sp. UWO 241]|nr:hypothetical protein FOA52_005009 [Chlamydomonas sp. UWO 241]
MQLAHAQEQAASTEAVQAVLLTGDLFGVVWQHLNALRHSPPVPVAPDFGFDRSATAALRLVSGGMRDLVDSVVAQLAVPLHDDTSVSLETCLPHFAASLRELTLDMRQLGDVGETRDLSSVQLQHLEKLNLRRLHVSDCHKIADLGDLCRLLTRLVLFNCSGGIDTALLHGLDIKWDGYEL